jgi:hypothetical protein
MATINFFLFFVSFFAYYFLKLHLHHFSKIKSHKEVTKQHCCGSGIRDWVPLRPLDPGSGMGRKSASGSGMNNPDHIFKNIETIFILFLGLKYLNSLMRIRDPGWRQFGSGIRDRKKSDPGSGINIPDPQHCKTEGIKVFLIFFA